ncbi:MAG: acetyl-CoA carboxylase biotin carboxyl carrier protein subunit [Candidatus Eremiobacteraeota bacterium]|nr:acetyl-CoA carboxylase biotin carboxyl carrier protein subunit [Candidatus Eremiobacteraeota bacterium]MCW5866148.1 acetyl-CoA carboxylase biotin carboxyl carrier protein subunit [Candidatus Eremiobacteraeota bacterium]
MKLNLSSGPIDTGDIPWEYIQGNVRNKNTGRQLPVRVAHLDGNRYQIWLSGQIYEVELASSGPKRAGADAAQSNERVVKSSMPGTILAVKVKKGEEVEAGQALIIMESMKMELTLGSPRAGKVARVLVHPGKMVELGATLLELEV